MPTCWIIAGPNGAGKTTFALDFLPEVAKCHQYLNADLIAAGLSPLAPARAQHSASRVFLHALARCVAGREDFAFETTLAGRGYLRLVQRLREAGWRVEMVYLALPSREMSRLRVAERVAHGGHDVPQHDIERRFSRSLVNLLEHFSYAVTQCHCIFNGGEHPEPVFEQQGENRHILQPAFYQLLLAASQSPT
ncbi:zeta toxin family protein [Achromobacter sp. GG226]|nr:zeta toxin family protein [Verticiella sp. GG226]